jgi:hypothetical protein
MKILSLEDDKSVNLNTSYISTLIGVHKKIPHEHLAMSKLLNVLIIVTHSCIKVIGQLESSIIISINMKRRIVGMSMAVCLLIGAKAAP